MNHHSDESEFSFIEIANYTYSHRLAIICCSLALATIVGTWNFFFKRPTYKTMTPISVDLKNNSPLGAAAFNNPWVSDQKIKKKIHITRSFFRSRRYQEALLNEIFGKAKLIQDMAHAKDYLAIVRTHLGKQKVETVDEALDLTYGTLSLLTNEDANTLNVVSTAHRPELAMAMSNLAAMLLVEYNHQHLIREIASVEKFITSQTKTVKEKLNLLEHELAALQKKSQLLSVASYQASLDKSNLTRQSELESLEIKVATGDFFIKEIENSINSYKQEIKSTNTHSYLAVRQIQRKIDLLKYQQALNSRGSKNTLSRVPAQQKHKNAINKKFEEMDSIFKKQKKSWSSISPWEYLQNLEKDLNTAQQEHQKNRSNLIAMKKALEINKENFQKIPDAVRNISQLNRDIKITSHLYSELKSRLQEIQIQIAGKANDLVIILHAQIPGSAMGLSAPKKYLLALVGGGFICILFLILRYLVIPTVRNSTDLKRVGMKFIGEIAYWRPKKVERQKREFPLLLDLQPFSLEANAIRHIRFNLQQEINNHRKKNNNEQAFIMALCSANSSEGKSFIASNLADSFSKAQLRTAIIDMDTVKPSVHKFFQNSESELPSNDYESIEVSDLYFEKTSATEFLDIIEIKVNCQSAIDILDSHYLPDYLNTLRHQYDIIFIDTAPLRNSLEGLVASRNSDAVIFVADQRVSLRHDVFKSFEALRGSFPGTIYAILNFCYDEFSKNDRRSA